MAEAAVGPQEVPLAGFSLREIGPGAHLHHLRPAGFTGGRDVMQVFRMGRIGDVDDGHAVLLCLAGQRIRLLATVVPDIEDAPIALLDR